MQFPETVCNSPWEDSLAKAQAKTKPIWRPSALQRRVSEVARLTAEREAAHVPWPQLYAVREKYVEWEAFALWARAIEDTEGNSPEWLGKAVEKRCRGFLKLVADKRQEHPGDPTFFWYHLERWINQRIFGQAWQGGWMNAVGYYAARDLASLRNHAYWEYCERQWKHSKPAAYPSFQEWRKASERCSEQVLDECQMREEKRRLIKLSRRVGPRTLRKAVERYLEWEIFGYWVRTALESGCPLPASVEGAVRQRCPNFLEADAAAHAANPEEEPHCRFNRMIKWVEDHEFTDAKTRGWFDVLLHQARMHPRHARVIDYWHDWEAEWEKAPSPEYPSFAQWEKATDRHTFEMDDG